MGNVNIPANLVGHYEDWADGGMIEVEAVQTKDIPAIVAGELERIADAAHEAAQSFTTANMHVRHDDYSTFARNLRTRAAALKADQR